MHAFFLQRFASGQLEVGIPPVDGSTSSKREYPELPE
jgi:hypothetical protein